MYLPPKQVPRRSEDVLFVCETNERNNIPAHTVSSRIHPTEDINQLTENEDGAKHQPEDIHIIRHHLDVADRCRQRRVRGRERHGGERHGGGGGCVEPTLSADDDVL